MGALLGLAAALAYGVSDFIAGVASRRHHFTWVSLLGFVAALLASGVAVVVEGVRPQTRGGHRSNYYGRRHLGAV